MNKLKTRKTAPSRGRASSRCGPPYEGDVSLWTSLTLPFVLSLTSVNLSWLHFHLRFQIIILIFFFFFCDDKMSKCSCLETANFCMWLWLSLVSLPTEWAIESVSLVVNVVLMVIIAFCSCHCCWNSVYLRHSFYSPVSSRFDTIQYFIEQIWVLCSNPVLNFFLYCIVFGP